MSGINFDAKAKIYEETGLVQKMNAEILLELAGSQRLGDVLDLGCGPGGAAAKIAGLTKGRVVGVDLSGEMIKQAKAVYALANLEFAEKDAARLGFNQAFDTIFCNSAFQWFQQPDRVLEECFKALKPGGIMVVQAPATAQYCPVFIKAVAAVASDPATAAIYRHFRNPLLLLDTAEEYSQLFIRNGFHVDHSKLVPESNLFSEEKVLGIFKSGAENAYLNQEYYETALNDGYIDAFRSIIKRTIQSLADSEGNLNLRFTRIYLKASKPQ